MRLFRTIPVALLAMTAAVPLAAQSKAGNAINIPFERLTLPNGLEVVLAPDHTVPPVAVNVYYHVGSKNEVTGRTGFAHLFEHVMFTGSGHVPYGMHDRLTEGDGVGRAVEHGTQAERRAGLQSIGIAEREQTVDGVESVGDRRPLAGVVVVDVRDAGVAVGWAKEAADPGQIYRDVAGIALGGVEAAAP